MKYLCDWRPLRMSANQTKEVSLETTVCGGADIWVDREWNKWSWDVSVGDLKLTGDCYSKTPEKAQEQCEKAMATLVALWKEMQPDDDD